MTTRGGGWTRCGNVDEIVSGRTRTCVVETDAYVDQSNLVNISFCTLLFQDTAPQGMMVHNRTSDGVDDFAEGDRVFIDWSATPITPGVYDNTGVQCEHLDADGTTRTVFPQCQYASHSGPEWQSAAWSFTFNGIDNGYFDNWPNRVNLGPTYFSCAAGIHWHSFAAGTHPHDLDWGDVANVGDLYLR